MLMTARVSVLSVTDSTHDVQRVSDLSVCAWKKVVGELSLFEARKERVGMSATGLR